MGETGQATDRDRSTVDAKRSRSWLGWIAAYFVTIYLIWFFVSAVILAASEGGSVPPMWRDPDIPAGAEVVSASEVCGGNGPCWRELRIRPAEGQDASDLAAEMGLSEDESRTYGWRPTNPASVEVFLPYGRLGQQYLKVGVQYASPFPFP